MKKVIAVAIAIVLLTATTAGCTQNSSTEQTQETQQTQNPTQEPTKETTQESETEATVEATAEETHESMDVMEIAQNLEHRVEDEDAPVVYITTDISPEGLVAIYETLGVSPEGNVAIKLHTGEGEDSNHLRPEFINGLVQLVDGTIVECNTAYGGSRASTAMHLQLVEDRGYTAIAPVDIMDAEGGMEIPVTGGTHLETNQVGANLANYDFLIMLSHFKGHQMGGFGGALKNMSIGIASSEGKSLIHTAGASRTGIGFNTPVDSFTESMAEAAKSVSDYMNNGENVIYINVMNNISIDCDCVAHPAEPDMHDIGIFASLDPVALDQACVDFVYAAPDGGSVIQRIESRNGTHILEHCEAIGFGSRSYRLVNIDD